MATYPEQDVNRTQPRLQSDERNPLHDFASYNCLFTLSGISEDELQSQRRLFNPQLHDIIARSAGIGGFGENFAGTKQPGNQSEDISRGEDVTIRPKIPADYRGSYNILSRGHDIFFENVNITSTVGPNTERNLANFTKMEFELHEPYGVTFIEKIRAALAA